jgi:hypothetical protein
LKSDGRLAIGASCVLIFWKAPSHITNTIGMTAVMSAGRAPSAWWPRARPDHAVAQAREITDALRRLGFTWVTLDLLGQRRGSLLEAFPVRPA